LRRGEGRGVEGWEEVEGEEEEESVGEG